MTSTDYVYWLIHFIAQDIAADVATANAYELYRAL